MNPVFQQLKVRERIVVCRKELYERKARKILHLMDLSITDIDGKLIDLCQWKDSKPEPKKTRHVASNVLVFGAHRVHRVLQGRHLPGGGTQRDGTWRDL